MPQVRSGGSHSHTVVRTSLRSDEYRIAWCTDHKYAGSRLRHVRSHSRDTDEKGARAFCKKHGLTFPEVPATQAERVRAILGKLRIRAHADSYGLTPRTLAIVLGLSEDCVRSHLTRLRRTGTAVYSPRGWFRTATPLVDENENS